MGEAAKNKEAQLFVVLFKVIQGHQKLSSEGKEDCLRQRQSVWWLWHWVPGPVLIYSAGNTALKTTLCGQKHLGSLRTYGSNFTSQTLFIGCIWGKLSLRNYFLSLKRELITALILISLLIGDRETHPQFCRKNEIMN